MFKHKLNLDLHNVTWTLLTNDIIVILIIFKLTYKETV